MFDHSVRRAGHNESAGIKSAAATAAKIAQLGFVAPRLYGSGRTRVCGLSLPVSIAEVIAEECLSADRLDVLVRAVSDAIPVCLHPEDFPTGVSTIDSWRQFCETIRTSMVRREVPTTGIGFCMHSHRMPLEAYCLIADSLLGCGPRHVFLDSLQMATHRDRRIVACAEANWTFLWRQRTTARPVLPVYGGLVRSACKLLADEVATTPISATSLLAPTGTAWVPVGLPITRFCSPDGRIERRRLEIALRQMVKLADDLYDQVGWHDPRQRSDAIANRRLAVHLFELGDLLQRSNRSPATLQSLNWLSELLSTIKCELASSSAQLAIDSGMLPSLTLANPVGHWKKGVHRERWWRHWEDAIRHAAVRNRNLLVMSPASILPANGIDGASYADLLPLLAFADAWCFASNGPMPGWTIPQFRKFHRRARATIQGSQRTSFVAAGV